MAGKALHIVVLGAEGVGKTAFISKVRFDAPSEVREAHISANNPPSISSKLCHKKGRQR